MGGLVSHFLFQPPSDPTPVDRSKLIWIETELGSRIPATFIRYPDAKYTILYSHGNAEDLGMIQPFLVDVGRVIKVNVMAYDYTGYGLSRVENSRRKRGNGIGGGMDDVAADESFDDRDFDPSEEHCYADITAVYDYLTRVESIPSSRIVLYGRSVGSGPSVYLARRMSGIDREGEGIAGIVLHSPFMSVCRVVVDLGFTVAGDVFPNIDRLPQIDCPVYIIHGTKDEIVPFYHGQELYNAVLDRNAAMPFWAEEMGHNDIEVKMPTAYIKRLYRFVSRIEKQAMLREYRAITSSSSWSSAATTMASTMDRHLNIVRSDSSLDADDWAPVQVGPAGSAATTMTTKTTTTAPKNDCFSSGMDSSGQGRSSCDRLKEIPSEGCAKKVTMAQMPSRDLETAKATNVPAVTPTPQNRSLPPHTLRRGSSTMKVRQRTISPPPLPEEKATTRRTTSGLAYQRREKRGSNGSFGGGGGGGDGGAVSPHQSRGGVVACGLEVAGRGSNSSSRNNNNGDGGISPHRLRCGTGLRHVRSTSKTSGRGGNINSSSRQRSMNSKMSAGEMVVVSRVRRGRGREREKEKESEREGRSPSGARVSVSSPRCKMEVDLTKALSY